MLKYTQKSNDCIRACENWCLDSGPIIAFLYIKVGLTVRTQKPRAGHKLCLELWH